MNTERKNFAIVFPNKLLRGVDEKKYEMLEAQLGISVNIVDFETSKDLKKQVDPKSEVLIDEADQVLLDHAKCFDNRHIVGLTATNYTERLLFEKDFLLHHKFEFVSSPTDTFVNADKVQEISLSDFLSGTDGYAKLIYA